MYRDKLYRLVDNRETVLIDLMNTASVQRLKRIGQAGPMTRK